MKFILSLLLLLPLVSFAQETSAKHPRVLEVEEKLRDEASRYFSRRYPGEPFFVKVEVFALRRDKGNDNKNVENLPYFDYESEEIVDEWDDPTTPLTFLRNRVTKVVVEMSVPEVFNDQIVADIKNDLTAYLKLLPYRDDVKVERKLKTNVEPFLPPYFYFGLGSLVVFSVILGFILRWGIKTSTPNESSSAGASGQVAMSSSSSSQSSGSKGTSKTNASVSGDLTFHDPLKTLDIIQHKMGIITKSETFPTLKDMIALHEFGTQNPHRLGAVIRELPSDWQKIIFALSKDEMWLEAFSSPGTIDHECIFLFDRMGRERDYQSGEREWESLLIHIWRMGDKAAQFVKKMDQDHAFLILSKLPKSISLRIAKKAFPGSWGRLLDNQPNTTLIDSKILGEWMRQAVALHPAMEWKMLEAYKKDREILAYLDLVSIEDEKDIYETLNGDSFVFNVRPPFYKVFDLPAPDFAKFLASFPLEKWALAVMNSSRSYLKQVTDCLDDRKKVVFSNYLRNLDQSAVLHDQAQCRKMMAHAASVMYVEHYKQPNRTNTNEDVEDHAQTA